MARRPPPARRPRQQLSGGCMFGACGDCMACFGGEGAEGPPSPCIKVCSLDEATGWCVGCGRAAEEIGDWSKMSALDKRDLLMRLPDRLARLEAVGKRRFAPDLVP